MHNILVEEQYRKEEEFLKEFKKSTYTIEKPFIVLDPYGFNPLSAYVCFTTEEETAITVVVKGKNKAADIVQTFKKSKTHILPVYGLYLNDTTTVILSRYQGESFSHKITTENIDFDEDIVIDFQADPIVFENKFLVYATPTTNFRYHLPFGIDSNGDIRWLLKKSFNWDFRKLKNGRIMVGSGDVVVEPYHVTGLYEIDWMGKIHVFYNIETLYHHDFLELEGNKLLVLTNMPGFQTEEDSYIIFDRDSGKILKRLDYKNIVDVNKVRRSGSWSERDWAHNNAVWYDQYSDSITLSMRHMDSLVNLDFETDEINWILSDPKGWDPEYIDKYLLSGVGYNFDYTYGQHAVSVDNKGSITCFDNHYKGKKHPDYVEAKYSFSRGVRYKINLETMKIETEWNYGKDLGAEVFSPYISFVERYTDDHNLVHFGGITLEKGVIANDHGPKANEKDLDMESETIEISYGREVLHARVKGNYYRARKLNYLMDDYLFEHKKAEIVDVK